MNSQDLYIILAASVVGLVYLLILRRFDIYEKESYLRLLIVGICGGAISVISSLFLYKFIDIEYNFIDAIIKIGPIEEFSKLFALIIIYHFIKSDFNEIVDGLIYIAAISLGFSIIENIFYAFKSTEPFVILFQRSIFSVIGHISFSGYLGLAYFIHVKVRKNFVGIIFAMTIASFAHGLYDAVLFHKELNFLFRILFYGIIVMQFILFKVVLGFSTFRKTLSLELFKPIERTLFTRCPKCDISIKDKGLRFWKINGVICKSCDSLVFSGENVSLLFKYFRPALRIQSFYKKLPGNKKIKFLDNNEKVLYNCKRTILSSSIPDLSEWLNKSNKQDREKILEIPFIGNLLWFLGIRYLPDE